jgi:predicted ATPase/DNA-binding SARP family transcriptional activator
MATRAQLFGSPTIESDGATFALPFERRSQLVVWLALRRDWVGRAELAALLWPDQEPRLAYSNLRKTLFRLHGLPWGARLEAQGHSLRYLADTDVDAFERALSESRAADAVALWRGPLLAGFDDDANGAWTDWLRFERDRLRASWRGAALEQLASLPAGTRALDLSARLLEADPLDEVALRAHLAQLATSGQAARARLVYSDFAARLQAEFGVAPGPELQALHDSFGGPAHAAATALADAVARDPDQGLIGRAAERRQIQDLLARDAVRLLCLAGPGGVGKTRLARCVVDDLAPAFADGASFVLLEDVGAPGELAVALARATGTALRGGAPPLQQLVEALRARQLLLVLDNFEQLVDHAQVLQSLLDGCPRLKLLVTSRVRLGLADERLLVLEGLPAPEDDDIDRIDAFDATRLFVRAARRVEPALIPSAEAAAIVEICRRVDGLPLALELAAAWTRMLSCEAIAAQLRAGTELLHATDPTQPARHASIDQVFEQSWQRLAAAERVALTRLAVFRGGFSAESARAVAAAPLPILGALADKSLLRKEGSRLSLHPLVQQLAAERLDDDAAASARSAHAAYFLQMLAQLAPAVEIGERAALLRVDTELENCRLAWQWSIDHGDVESLKRVAPTLQRHFDHRGRFEAALALLQPAIDAPALRTDSALQAVLLGEVAQCLYRLDRYAEAITQASRALTVAGRKQPERSVRLRALGVLSVCALRLGRLDEARRHLKEVLRLAAAENRPQKLAAALDHMALVEKRAGRYDEALQLALRALEQYRAIGDDAGVALCLNNLATLYQARRDDAAARPHLEEALRICERVGLTGTLGYVLSNFCEVEARAGEVEAARAYAQRGIEVADASGNRALAAALQIHLARLDVQRGELEGARHWLATGLGTANRVGVPSLRAHGLLCFAELLHAHGETPAAQRVLAIAIDHPATDAPERDEMQTLLARWQASPVTDGTGAPRIGVDELLHRIVVEAERGHLPLRALLGGRGNLAATH